MDFHRACGKVEAAGIEPPPQTAGHIAIAVESGTESGAQEALNDSDLAVVVEAWPTLPEPIKAGILAMIGKAAP